MTSIEDIRDQRVEKVKLLQDKGIEAYPVSSNINTTNAEFTDSFKDLLDSQKEIIVGGRIISVRGQGKLGFVDMIDGTSEKVQCFLSLENLGEEYIN